jgi:hypothetical protein
MGENLVVVLNFSQAQGAGVCAGVQGLPFLSTLQLHLASIPPPIRQALHMHTTLQIEGPYG